MLYGLQMTDNLCMREILAEQSGTSRMIDMDMRQENIIQMGDTH